MYIALAIIFAFLLLQVGVALWERRAIWPYTELQDYPRIPDKSPYPTNRIHQACALGFHFLGWAGDRRGTRYLLNYAFLVAPEREAIVTICVGNIIGMRVESTIIHTPAVDGQHLYYTADHQVGIEIDHSGQWKSQLAANTGFQEQWAKHRSWLAAQNVTPRTFTYGHELDEHRQIRHAHFQHLASLGLIKFIDSEKEWWRFSFKGALKNAFIGYVYGMLRALTGGRFPKTA